MSIELTMKRGEEAVAATIDVRDDVTLTEAYDAAAAGLHPMTVRAGAYLGRVLDNLTPVGEVSAPQQEPGPVIDWDSAPEGFPVWIEDVVPFGDSASCWAKDAGSHYLGVNGSKWNKPGDAIFCAHHRTQSIAEIIAGADRAVFDRPYVAKDCSPVMAAALLEQLRSSKADQNRRSVVLMTPAPVSMEFQPSIDCVDAAGVMTADWAKSPVEATHWNDANGLWYAIDLESNTAAFCGGHTGRWIDASPATDYLTDGNLESYLIARPTSPAEKWSLDGKDGNWNYDTLAELIIDCYGHDGDGDGHPASGTPGLYEGDTIYRGIACFDDPVRFLPEAHDVLDHMADATSDSDASEYADNYPDVDDEARAALEVALEPLKAWARKHCQPDFFTVQDVTPYILTVEDVRAAKAQERAR